MENRFLKDQKHNNQLEWPYEGYRESVSSAMILHSQRKNSKKFTVDLFNNFCANTLELK